MKARRRSRSVVPRYIVGVALCAAILAGTPLWAEDMSMRLPPIERDLGAEIDTLEAELDAWNRRDQAAAALAAQHPQVRVGGLIQWDNAAFNQNPASIAQAGDMKNGTEFRRAWLLAEGTAFEVIDFRAAYDFAGNDNYFNHGQTHFRDVFMQVRELPWLGNVRAGQFFECFGLETQTEPWNLTFMERSLFNEGGPTGTGLRKPGVKVFDAADSLRGTWAAGVFAWQAPSDPPTFPGQTWFDDNGGAAFDTRVTAIPWLDSNGAGLLHLGAGYTCRSVAGLVPGAPPEAVRYAILAKPESNLGLPVANTGALNSASFIHGFNPELALAYGPWLVQTEYKWLWVEQTGGPPLAFDGGYVNVSYFLTQENRRYDYMSGVFGEVIPNENFFRVRDEDGNIRTGLGAVEVAYRCSWLNLTDADIHGGRVLDHTFGLNWYLNRAVRMTFNYVRSTTCDRGSYPCGAVDIVEGRCQLVF